MLRMAAFIALFTGCTPTTHPEADDKDGAVEPTPVDTADTADPGIVVTETTTVIDDTGDTGWKDTWDLEVELTMDDAWAMWIDGDSMGSSTGWSHADTIAETVTITHEGPHVVAVHGWDEYSVISGFLSVVKVDGTVEALTGDGQWKMTTTEPDPKWIYAQYDDSAWGAPARCTDTSPWGTTPAVLRDQGAEWIWHNSNCRVLGEAWFRLIVTI